MAGKRVGYGNVQQEQGFVGDVCGGEGVSVFGNGGQGLFGLLLFSHTG